MASSDEDAPTPKRARGSGKVQRGRKIPFLTFTEERSYPPDYDYTRVLDYFSDEDRDESSHEEEEEEEEEEEVGDDSDADASDDCGSDDVDVGGGDGDDDGDSSDDDDDDGVDFGYREDRKQVRRAARGRLTRGRGSRVRGRAHGQGRVGGRRGGRKHSARARGRGAGRGEGSGSDGDISGVDDEWVDDDTAPQEMEFTGNPGITSDRPTSALGFIQLFFTRALLNYLTEETNMYAMYCWDVLKKKTMPSTGRGVVWGT